MSQQSPYNPTITKKKGSLIELRASIEATEWESHRNEALKELNAHVSIDGFRKGKVPESILVQKLGESAVVEEMAEIAISRAYPKIIVSEKLQPIGRPRVELTKIAKESALEFRLETAVLPSISLPDYQKIAQKEGTLEKVEVPEKEIDDTITQILRMRAEGEAEKAGVPFDANTALPELTDEYVKTLGKFESVTDFRTKLKTQVEAEKNKTAEEKRRAKILDALASKTDIDMPDILVDGELDRLVDQFGHDVTRAGGTLEEYLEHSKKTIEEIRKEWRPDAEKRAKIQLIIDAIAEKEKVEPDQKEVTLEKAALLRAYPEADEHKAEDFIRFQMTNRLTIDRLVKIAEEA